MDELYKKIREGSDEESLKAYNSLMSSVMRGATVAIMARNFSHGVGNNLKKYADSITD